MGLESAAHLQVGRLEAEGQHFNQPTNDDGLFIRVADTGRTKGGQGVESESVITSGNSTPEDKLRAFDSLIPQGGNKTFEIGGRSYTVSKEQLGGGRTATSVFTVGDDGKNYVYLRGILNQKGEVTPQQGVDGKQRPIMGERWTAKMNEQGQLVLVEDANARVSAAQAQRDREDAAKALTAAQKDLTAAEAERAQANKVLQQAEDAKREAEIARISAEAERAKARAAAEQTAKIKAEAAELSRIAEEDVSWLVASPGEKPSLDAAKQRLSEIQKTPDSLITRFDLSGASGYRESKPTETKKDDKTGKTTTAKEGSLEDGTVVKTTDIRDQFGNLLQRSVHASDGDSDNNNGLASLGIHLANGHDFSLSHVTDMTLKWSNSEHAYTASIKVASGETYTFKCNDKGGNVEAVIPPANQRSPFYVHPYDMQGALNQPYLTGRQVPSEGKTSALVASEPVPGKPGWTKTQLSFTCTDAGYDSTIARDMAVHVTTINDADGRLIQRSMTFEDTTAKNSWLPLTPGPTYQGIERVTQIDTIKNANGGGFTIRVIGHDKDKREQVFEIKTDADGKPLGAPSPVKK